MEASGSETRGGTPPGWYDDPWAPGTLRWWDGAGWTGHTSAPGVAHPSPAGPAAASSHGHGWLWVAGAAATVMVVAVGIGLFVAIREGVFGDDPTNTRNTSPVQPVAPTAPPSQYQSPRSNRLPEVALGRSVDLTTQDRSRVRVTALTVVDPVARGTYLLRPKRGGRWVGLRLKVEGLGPGLYKDAPTNGSRLLGGGRSFRAVTKQPDGCPSLDVLLRLAPGQSATGCVIFEIPRGSSVGRFRFTPSSGFAPDVATWRLPPRR